MPIILRTAPLALLMLFLLLVVSSGQSTPPHPLEILEIKLDDVVSVREHYGALGFVQGEALNPAAQADADLRCKGFWGSMAGFRAENITAIGLFDHSDFNKSLLVCKFKLGVPNYLASRMCKARGAWLFKNFRATSLVLCAREIPPSKGKNNGQARAKKT